MGSKKPERTRVWRNYFTMIFRAGLPWALMIVCFLLSLGAAQLALTFANKMADALTSWANIHLGSSLPACFYIASNTEEDYFHSCCLNPRLKIQSAG